jgi:SAM-dependent methyltransferase
MRAHAATSLQTAFAQPFTEELIVRCGIGPGMRVLVLGSGTGDLAFLVAERVGVSGTTIGVDADPRLVDCARRRAREQRFDRISFHAGSLDALDLGGRVDAVIARFFLMRQNDPVAAIRQAASLVHPGGRVAFQEWHFESTLWQHTSSSPQLALYGQFARWITEGLRRDGAHPDMGLRLVNAVVEAGLPLPATRTDLRATPDGATTCSEFLAEALREQLPSLERHGIASAAEVRIDTFAERLRHEAREREAHAFYPLLVSAWTRTPVEPAT